MFSFFCFFFYLVQIKDVIDLHVFYKTCLISHHDPNNKTNNFLIWSKCNILGLHIILSMVNQVFGFKNITSVSKVTNAAINLFERFLFSVSQGCYRLIVFKLLSRDTGSTTSTTRVHRCHKSVLNLYCPVINVMWCRGKKYFPKLYIYTYLAFWLGCLAFVLDGVSINGRFKADRPPASIWPPSGGRGANFVPNVWH